MRIIQNLTDDAYQSQTILLDDGTTFLLEIKYRPLQLGWFIEKLEYNNVVIAGMRVCVSPNMLHQFRNQLPFGLACSCENNREPTLSSDFSEKKAVLYLLSESEVDAYTEYLSGS